MKVAAFVTMFLASSAWAGEVDLFEADDLAASNIVIIGEIHDHPGHHQVQADVIAALSPKVVVFEMLTAAQAALIDPSNVGSADLGKIIGWEDAGWPDFALYAPIFEALDGAHVVGAAAPSDIKSIARKDGAIAALGEDATRFGLDQPLQGDEQEVREAGMQAGHCGALPPEMLPWFVEQQRFADAHFARATLDALATYGPPIVVITGNGHARNDWGMPVYLRKAAPDVTVISLGQEVVRSDAPYDFWRITDPVPGPEKDHCAAFENR